MFKISYDKKITMVQGDTGVIRMRIHNYKLSQGDEVRFAIVNKGNPSILLCQHSDKKIVLEKQVTAFEKDGDARIVIYPYDTENLQPGKYLYEIQVKTKDGRIDTVVPLASFTLMEGSIQGEYGQTTPSDPSTPDPTPSEIELRFVRLESEIIPELGNRIINVENEIDSVNSSLDDMKNSTIAYNVMNYGFDDKGELDNTQKLNDLINLVAENGGGIIKFPTGKFKLENQIIMKPYVRLEGVMPWRGKDYEGYSVFLCYSLNEAQFLLREYCSIANFYFDYPNQVGNESDEPIPYEWTIKTDTTHLSDDIQLSNLYLPNAYKGICLERAGRFNLDNIYGQPIKHGLYIDEALDVGNINRVEFWTFNYYVGSKMYDYILSEGTAFEFKKVDGFLANNLFAYGYNKCYHLNGGVWGTFNGCCSDKCYQPILVNNCNIVEFIGGAFIGSSNKSVICKINNVYDSFKVIGCNFFGGCSVGVLNKSDSGKILIDCNFKDKDDKIAIPILNSANNYITVRRHGDEHLIGFCNVDGVKNLKASDNVVLSLNKSNLSLNENVTETTNGFKVNMGEQVIGENLISGNIRIDDKSELPHGYYYLEFKMKGKITTDRKRFCINVKKDVGEPVYNWLIVNLPLIDEEIIIRLPFYLGEKPYITLLAVDFSYYDEPIATGDYIDITDMKIIKMNNLLNSSIEEIYKQSYVYSSKIDYDL